VRAAVLAACAGDGPDARIEIQLTPAHVVDLSSSLRGEQSQSPERPHRRRELLTGRPHGADFVLGQQSRPLPLLFAVNRTTHLA
jgi:hypothetical protein